MLARPKWIALLTVAIAPLGLGSAGAQRETVKPSTAPGTVAAAEARPAASDVLNRTQVLRAAADALGMLRWSDVGAGRNRLPAVDVSNRMEIWASGTTYASDSSNLDAPRTALKADYHMALGYNPPAMRVEMTRADTDRNQPDEGSHHTILTVRDNYAWNESEIGAGLEPGRGSATPAMTSLRERLLQLWILPYGVVKAAIAAGDKTTVSAENGATIITFPLSGQLADIRVKATLDAQNFVSKVETQTDGPGMSNLVMEADYSGYADRGEILSDLKFPGRIVRKQGGHPVLDIQVAKADLNNPYLVFPVPENVKNAAAQEPVRATGDSK